MDERESTESQDSSIFRPWEKSSPVRVHLPKSSNMTTPSPVSSTRRCYDFGSSPVLYSVSEWPLYSTPVSHQYREWPALQPQMSPVVPGISDHHVTPHHMTSPISPSSIMSSPVVTAGLGYTGLTTSPVSEADSGYTSASPVDMTTSELSLSWKQKVPESTSYRSDGVMVSRQSAASLPKHHKHE